MMEIHNSMEQKLFINYYEIEKSIKRNRKAPLEEILQITIKTWMKGWGREELLLLGFSREARELIPAKYKVPKR